MITLGTQAFSIAACVLIGAFSFIFSSIWPLKNFIDMRFAITGGLYWKRGTTSAAWTGLLSVNRAIIRDNSAIWSTTVKAF